MIRRSDLSRCKHQRLPVQLATALAASLVLCQSQAGSYEGKSVRIGKGTAHVVVRTDANDKPSAIGIVFTPGMLDGLPKAATGAMPDFPYFLPMPGKGPKTVVDHVVINWESVGHPPPRVYDVPHFDFHFYLVSRAAQKKVRFKNEGESGQPPQQPPSELLPQGYAVPPGTAVTGMGVHAINMSAGELHGQPFTTTFIYGYYNRHQTFLEPMVALDYLLSKPSFSAAIARPSSYTKPGSYPGAYSVKYDAGRDVYEVMLEELND